MIIMFSLERIPHDVGPSHIPIVATLDPDDPCFDPT